MIRAGWRSAICLLAMLLLCTPLAGHAQAGSAAAPLQLSVQTLDGKTFNLAGERGKWVIVNFWATWCSPCLAEMPDISRYVAAHKNVAAIGLAYQPEPLADVLKFVHKHPVDYPLARIDMQRPPAGFAMPMGLPTTDLIAPDGRLAKCFIGPINAKLLDAAIAAYAKGDEG